MTERAAYRIQEFADAIGVSRKTVEKWMRRGEIPSFRLGSTRFIPTHALAHATEGATRLHNDPLRSAVADYKAFQFKSMAP